MRGVQSGGKTYFNPLPPRGGRRYTNVTHWVPLPISIHSLLAEGDERSLRDMLKSNISIHSLLAEGDNTGILS